MHRLKKYIEAQLTSRELSILQLACDGFSDKEIATQLNLKLPTILTYWTRIREKMGSRSRIAIVSAYLRAESESRIEALRQQLKQQKEHVSAEADDFASQVMKKMDELRPETSAAEKWRALESCLEYVGAYLSCSSSEAPYACFSITESAEKLGLDVDGIRNGQKSIASTYHPDDLKALMSIFESHGAKGPGRIYSTTRIITPDGLKTILLVANVLEDKIAHILHIDVQPLVDSGILPDSVIVVHE